MATATLKLAGSFLELSAYNWGSISSGDSKLTETVTNGREATEEDCVGNLIVNQKFRHKIKCSCYIYADTKTE